MKVDRLFSIVHILLNKQRVTAKELAETFEVSTRTIYRDIDILSRNNVPIYTDKGRGGGISLLDSFVLDKSMITEEEKSSIIMGLEILKATKYDDVNGAIEKLKSLFDTKSFDYIEVDFSKWETGGKHKQMFNDIKHALQNNRVCKINYIDSFGQGSIRRINPLKLVFKVNRWYLIAYCHVKKDYRIFRLSRFNELQLCPEVFDRKLYDVSHIVLDAHDKKNERQVLLTLNKNALYRVSEEFEPHMITGEDPLIITFNMVNDSYLHNYIMSFGEYLIDIQPENIKKAVLEKTKQILNQLS